MPLTPSTGRFLVLLAQRNREAGVRTLVQAAGLDVVQTASAGASLPPNCVMVFDQLGVALLRCAPDKAQAIGRVAADSPDLILAVEPERTVRAIVQRREPGIPSPVDQRFRVASMSSAFTWGVEATGAASTSYSGRGIRVAILDTGFDLQHPDFAARSVVSRSFIDRETVQDGNGHGTHCVGVAGGPAHPVGVPRYGVAYEADLFVGKVLSDEGSGADGSVLEGLNWAIENGCHLVSLSLGTPVDEDAAYSRVFEEAARRALEVGTLVIAAAGNDSRRPAHIAPVSHPANCPSILAVAAIDEQLQIAPFSSGGLADEGGEVDLSGPGVAVFSSWAGPQRHDILSGTSMATPFVAGVAALHAEADLNARGKKLFDLLLRTARGLDLPVRDTGAGLVQAPEARQAHE